MSIKKTVKKILTFVRYPLLVIHLRKRGCSNFSIDKGLQINSLKNLIIGKNVAIGRHARLLFVSEYAGKEYSPKIEIGNKVSIGNRFSALSAAKIVIEDNNLIASDVLITSENHGLDPELTNSYADLPLIAAPVVIEKGCWIGEKVSILPGVTLGDRCIVAAGSVVTHSFPEKTMIAGIPARAIKKYNEEEHLWKKVEK